MLPQDGRSRPCAPTLWRRNMSSKPRSEPSVADEVGLSSSSSRGPLGSILRVVRGPVHRAGSTIYAVDPMLLHVVDPSQMAEDQKKQLLGPPRDDKRTRTPARERTEKPDRESSTRGGGKGGAHAAPARAGLGLQAAGDSGASAVLPLSATELPEFFTQCVLRRSSAAMRKSSRREW